MKNDFFEQKTNGQQKFDLQDRLLNYAASIIKLAERLPRTTAGTHIANQLLRSGTSPLPNHGEAQAAEPVADFIHKMSICLKELRESYRWLCLIERVPLVNPPSIVQPILQETDELIRIFVASIKTALQKKNCSVREDTVEYETGSKLDVESWTLEVQEP